MKKLQKILALSFVALFTLTTSCNKKSNDPTDPIGSSAPYYFNFALDGAQTTYRSNVLQTGHAFSSWFGYSIGGHVIDGDALSSDAIGISIEKDNGDPWTHQEVLDLSGQTISFNDQNLVAGVTMSEIDDTAPNGIRAFASVFRTSSYFISFSSIQHIGSDIGLTEYDIYLAEGTAKARLNSEEDGSGINREITNGEFSFRITREK